MAPALHWLCERVSAHGGMLRSQVFEEAVEAFKAIYPGWTAPMNKYPPGSGTTYDVVWTDAAGEEFTDEEIELYNFSQIR